MRMTRRDPECFPGDMGTALETIESGGIRNIKNPDTGGLMGKAICSPDLVRGPCGLTFAEAEDVGDGLPWTRVDASIVRSVRQNGGQSPSLRVVPNRSELDKFSRIGEFCAGKLGQTTQI